MQQGPYKFDRLEFSGSLGDLGTLIPLTVAMIILNGLSFTSVFLMVGLFYISTGLYFKLPIPVQPLKVVAALSIASPLIITESIIMAASILIGLILILIALTGIINWLAGIFSKPLIRGIQLGLGFILIIRGIEYIMKSELFLNTSKSIYIYDHIPANTFIGVFSVLTAIFLISNKRFPAALIIIIGGILTGLYWGALDETKLVIGIAPLKLNQLNTRDFINAFSLLVIPQIPLTIGNAIIGTADACKSFFKDDQKIKKVNPKSLSVSMGFMNLLIGILGGIPLCHGAGGLAAHYRFGARSGGSNIMIGLIFLFLAFLFGKIGISLLSLIPHAVLGTLLLFAGVELALLSRDVRKKKDLFLMFFVAGTGLATINMGLAVIIGFLIDRILKWKHIKI